jgi:ribosome-binding factor A
VAQGSGGQHPYPRSARVNEILREVVADVVVRLEDIDDRIGLLTVTGVETTPDMRQATVFFDSLPPEALEALDEHRAQIQASVNAQTRLKRTPKLRFLADPAVASGESVERILRDLQHGDDDR